ncbi:MAG: hypothetical protein AAF570_10070 [Bacteroidota bacterium]
MNTHLKYLLICGLGALMLAACTGQRKSKTKEDARPHHFTAVDKQFSFHVPATLQRFGWDSVPWAATMPKGDQNGVVVYFFLEGERVMLSAPQIRVEYVAKSMPGAETREQLFNWLKSVFVNSNREGRVMDETTELDVAGEKVRLLEIHTPELTMSNSNSDDDGAESHDSDDGEDRPVRAEKQMLWAFLSHGEYWIGLACSATNPAKFEALRPHFHALVRSFSIIEPVNPGN